MSELIPAILLSVGTELTDGIILNTHFRFLGAELKNSGFSVAWGIQIPDDPRLFESELRQAIERGRLVIITGGLGPTSDDLTRDIVSRVAKVPLKYHAPIWEMLKSRYRGRRIPETNKRQAFIPEGFDILHNAHGTAPGFYGKAAESFVCALPGPPRELEPMFEEQLLPRLKKDFHPALKPETKSTALLVPESLLEESLLETCSPGIEWGTRVADDRIQFTLRGSTESERTSSIQALQQRLDPVRIREGSVEPGLLLYEALKSKDMTLACAESCTGGLLGKMITDIAGASTIFWGSLVVYANRAKERLLDIDGEELQRQGAVSEYVAKRMAMGLLEKTEADLGIAVTGIAGPDGGVPDKPVGTVWITAARRSGELLCRHFQFHGNRDGIRRRSAVAALIMGECLLKGLDFPQLDEAWIQVSKP